MLRWWADSVKLSTFLLMGGVKFPLSWLFGLRHPLCREVARPLTRAAARPSAAEKLILDDTGAEENDSFRGVHPAAVGSELPWLTGAPA